MSCWQYPNGVDVALITRTHAGGVTEYSIVLYDADEEDPLTALRCAGWKYPGMEINKTKFAVRAVVTDRVKVKTVHITKIGE